MASDSDTSGSSHKHAAITLDEPEMSPSKRLKTLSSPSSSFSKGKDTRIDESTVDDSETHTCEICLMDKRIDESTVDDSERDCCGICLMEDGNAIRGCIDGCDHYFCFVCIMEWSKVESRCPLCKRRFTTIRRPPKDGLFLTERLVNVPVRDQVCHREIETPHPYSEVQCGVCRSRIDESRLLLCDLCDSAYHTYCVGLGATGPVGDWFCQDCTVSVVEYTKIEIDTGCASQTSGNVHEVPPAGASVSVFDIVAEPGIREVQRPHTTDSLRTSGLSSGIAPDRGMSVADNASEGDSTTPAVASNASEGNSRTPAVASNTSEGDSRTPAVASNASERYSRTPAVASNASEGDSRTPAVASNASERDSRTPAVASNASEGDSRTPAVASNATALAARTLQRYRNVHHSIRALRENWNGFRNGALSFCYSCTNHDKLSQPNCSSCKGQQLTAHNDASCNISQNRGSYDIEKAWKMMDAAKSIEKGRGRASFMHQASKHHSSKVNVPKGKANVNPCLLMANGKRPVATNLKINGYKNHYQYNSLEKVNDLHKSPMFEKQKQRTVTMVTNLKFGAGFPSNSQVYELPSARMAQTSAQFDICYGNGGKQSQEYSLGASSDVLKKHNGSAVGSVQIASNFTCGTSDASSSCKIETPEGKSKTERQSAKSQAKRDDNVKTEIQSLVKLNLKLLSGDKKLEVNAFKEVARLATHSILAACGLERPKPGVRSFPSSVCCHDKQDQQLRMSTLMPSSCRECFYVFVKNVVKTMMFEKVSGIQMA
ncbi:uncharacterized protein LOC132284219 [Cornus florida]|uniref:uncharacterized protein LOC132284219 n=1 Tax=Cornus florida TaxID=4283 RepID=UPI00289723C4|nr:uncharacterized protein LOC132284219 [Cornus florida]